MCCPPKGIPERRTFWSFAWLSQSTRYRSRTGSAHWDRFLNCKTISQNIMFRLAGVRVCQPSLPRVCLFPGMIRCVSGLPHAETSCGRRAFSVFSPECASRTVISRSSQDLLLQSLNDFSSAFILAPTSTPHPGYPELLMSSIIKKRKKKMNKHKWKKRRRLVRYKNKPWAVFFKQICLFSSHTIAARLLNVKAVHMPFEQLNQR